MRVDGHVHLWDAHAGAVPVPYTLPTPQALAGDVLAHMSFEHIGGAVLVQPQLHGSDHRLLTRALMRHPDRFVGFGLADADAASPDAVLSEVATVAELGLAGVRVHLVNGAGEHAHTVAIGASRFGLALELHVDEAAWGRLDRIIEPAGESLVVIDHLARPDDPRSRRARKLLRGLASYPNVVVKLAALDVVSRTPFPHDDVLRLISDAIEVLGAERLMWGSNFPWCRGEHYGASLRVIERLGLPEPANEAILGGTAGRLFFANQRQAVA